MVIGQVAAQVALTAFAAAILAGLYAGNSPVTVLSRALLVLAAAVVLGSAAAWVIKLVLRDHAQRCRQRIDEELARAETGTESAAGETPPAGAEA